MPPYIIICSGRRANGINVSPSNSLNIRGRSIPGFDNPSAADKSRKDLDRFGTNTCDCRRFIRSIVVVSEPRPNGFTL